MKRVVFQFLFIPFRLGFLHIFLSFFHSFSLSFLTLAYSLESYESGEFLSFCSRLISSVKSKSLSTHKAFLSTWSRTISLNNRITALNYVMVRYKLYRKLSGLCPLELTDGNSMFRWGRSNPVRYEVRSLGKGFDLILPYPQSFTVPVWFYL